MFEKNYNLDEVKTKFENKVLHGITLICVP